MKKFLIVVLILVVGLTVYFSSSTAVTANLDNYVYELPYQTGTSHKIVQGYGGMFSHKYKAALDFSMPVGTPVFAARGGNIYSIKDDSDKGGPWPKYISQANYIIIKHDDGSFGCYWHLKKNGVVVKKGKVEKGQLIGYSGNTGFVFMPHLHFAVKRELNYEKDSFIKTKFRTENGIEILEKAKVTRDRFKPQSFENLI